MAMMIHSTNKMDSKSNLNNLKGVFNDILLMVKRQEWDFQILHRDAYQICQNGCANELYQLLKDTIKSHFVRNVQPKIISCLNSPASSDLQTYSGFLSNLNQIYENNSISLCKIRDILLYMDYNHTARENKLKVFDLGLKLFGDFIINNPQIQKALFDNIFSAISKERRGEKIEIQSSIKNICQIMIKIPISGSNLYETFEKSFLQESRNFYKSESQRLLSFCDISIYLQAVEERFREESDRVKCYLIPSSEIKIILIVEEEMIENNLQNILDIEPYGINHLFETKNSQALGKLYRMVDRVQNEFKNGHEMLLARIVSYLQQEQLSILSGDKPAKIIKAFIELKNTFDNYIGQSFSNNKNFLQKIKDEFIKTVNNDSNFCEYLSLSITSKLQNCDNGSEPDLSDEFYFFKYVEDKDKFATYYQKHLAKRLLEDKSPSEDIEKTLISKLKLDLGTIYAYRLEEMLKSMIVSRELNAELKEFLRSSHPKIKVDLSVNIIRPVAWPVSAQIMPCNLSSEALEAFNAFKNFYRMKFDKRIVSLKPQFGRADMKAVFYGSVPNKQSPRTYTLNVSTYQMVILMLYNRKSRYTYEEIAEETQISPNALDTTLRALISPSPRAKPVLLKIPNNDDKNSFFYTVNDSFYSNHHRVKLLPVINKKETKPEKSLTLQQINMERSILIQATIVRIMKTRKEMLKNNLVAETIKHLIPRFKPDATMIDQQISKMIDKEYIAPANNNSSTLVYIA